MQFELKWRDMTIEGVGNATGIANEVVALVMASHCTDCGMDTLLRLDFSQLGNVEEGTVEEIEALLSDSSTADRGQPQPEIPPTQ